MRLKQGDMGSRRDRGGGRSAARQRKVAIATKTKRRIDGARRASGGPGFRGALREVRSEANRCNRRRGQRNAIRGRTRALCGTAAVRGLSLRRLVRGGQRWRKRANEHEDQSAKPAEHGCTLAIPTGGATVNLREGLPANDAYKRK